MKTIRDLNAPPQVIGRVEAIIVRDSPREPARRIAATEALAGIGLADDRLGRRGHLRRLPTAGAGGFVLQVRWPDALLADDVMPGSDVLPQELPGYEDGRQ